MTIALTHSNFFMLQKWWQRTDRTYIHSKLFIPFVVLFPCFSVCSATFTNAIQPIVWQWYLGKSWVTWAISRIQCKVFAYSDVCYKPPSVPLCCSFPVFCLLTGCIDHNIRRLWEPRVAQSWAFLVWEHSECTIRPVLPKPVKSGNCFVKKVNPIPARFSKVSPELHQIPILTHGVAIWEAGHAQLWNGGTERESISSLAQKGRTGVCVCLFVGNFFWSWWGFLWLPLNSCLTTTRCGFCTY